MSDFLKQMAGLSAQRAAAVAQGFKATAFDRPVLPLRLNGFDVIAEVKDRSPSEGELAVEGRSRSEQAACYMRGGAAAISVLTEPSRFAGSLRHLDEVASLAAADGVPVMRKDFLVDPVQVLEARAAGASGVLLIAAMLSDRQMAGMLDCAYEHSLFVLLESFDENDLRRTVNLLDADRHAGKAQENRLLVGVNTRNLRTLEVDGERLKNLASLLPASATCVAESGLHDTNDAANAVALGYRMALVGTALMRSDDPQGLIAGMLVAGRSA